MFVRHASAPLIDLALDDGVQIDVARAVAFMLGQARRVDVRKELFLCALRSVERRDVYYLFQRGYRNDLFGVAFESSQDVTELTTKHQPPFLQHRLPFDRRSPVIRIRVGAALASSKTPDRDSLRSSRMGQAISYEQDGQAGK